MIETLTTTRSDMVALEAVGTVTKEDYQTVIVPLFEAAYAAGTKLRFLYCFGSRFEGFSPAAAWEDFKVGMRFVNVLQRCAVVSDAGWIRSMTSMVGSMLPCPVRVFPLSERDEAMNWLASAEAPLEHHLDTARGLLSVEIIGPLSPDTFEVLSHTVDPWLDQGHRLNGVVIHARKFPGWENFGSLVRHLQFVRNHHRQTRRVAIAADGTMASLLPELARHFVEAEVKHFGFDELEKACHWAAEVVVPVAR